MISLDIVRVEIRNKMEKALTKKALVRLAETVHAGNRLAATEAEAFLNHRFPESSKTSKLMLKLAAAISFFFASVLVIFPEVGEKLIEVLPGVFLLPERIAKALDFVWGLVGKPVGKQHLMYHIPNIIIYAFGVAGVRQLWRRLHKNNWKDRVESAQQQLTDMIQNGLGQFKFEPGFSLLFVGDGDQIAKSLVMDDPTVGATISAKHQQYTHFWGKYAVSDGLNGFGRVLSQCNAQEAGEYVLFPVLDENLFLPGNEDYDLAPHRVDMAMRKIRDFEKANHWKPKRIIIVGDKEQTSHFITSSSSCVIESGCDKVSLRTIAAAYQNVTVLDPTEITLKKIINVADGRQILFRASDKGAEKYTKRFYHRLSSLGYTASKQESLIVGYDITDLETEHQIISRQQSDYLPVILSRDIFDEIEKNHLSDDPYIFVPRLVKRALQGLVAEQ